MVSVRKKKVVSCPGDAAAEDATVVVEVADAAATGPATKVCSAEFKGFDSFCGFVTKLDGTSVPILFWAELLSHLRKDGGPPGMMNRLSCNGGNCHPENRASIAVCASANVATLPLVTHWFGFPISIMSFFW